MTRTVVILLALLLPFAIPGYAQPVKIGYIDILRIERESARPKRGAEILKKEFASREQAVRSMGAKAEAMQAELAKLGPGTPAAELERRQRAFAELVQNFEQARRSLIEDVDRRRFEERQKFFNEIKAVVDKIAKAQNFDLILDSGVYASRAIDITPQVLKAIDAGK
ncbi:MAG: OmpH family outer membrane protein [Burkholderiales bacterium]|nr:OmpH family outer membrane protein [Burkholderiales bacterium]